MTPGDDSLEKFCHQTGQRNGAVAAYLGFYVKVRNVLSIISKPLSCSDTPRT